MSRVRLQVTHIATVCVVPRGGCPGDSTQGRGLGSAVVAGHWFLTTATGVEEEAVPTAPNTCECCNAIPYTCVHAVAMKTMVLIGN